MVGQWPRIPATITTGLDVRILGPLEVWVDGRRVTLAGGRQRALLALLALHHDQVVSSERLIDELWGESPTPTAAKGLQNLVAQLRRALGDGALLTRSPGYVLELEAEALDADRFERLADEGRQLLETNPARALGCLRAGEAFWRGSPLMEFAYERFAAVEIARLQERRLAALEDRFDAQLALGAGSELVAELDPLVTAHPLRERLRGQLMLAFYRDGRQSDALDAYRAGAAALHDLGLEPGAALRTLERAILEHDPTLGAPRRLPRLVSGGRRRGALGALAAALLAIGVTAAVLARGEGVSPPAVYADSLVRIDAATNRVEQVIGVGKDPGQLEVVGPMIFVAGQEDGTLARVASDSTSTISGRHDLTGGLAGAGASVWAVSLGRDELLRVDAATLEQLDALPLSADPSLQKTFIEVGGDSLWLSQWYPPAVSRWRVRTLKRVRRYPLLDAEYPLEVAYGHGAAWVALWTTNRVLRIAARDGRAAYFNVGRGPRDPLVAFGSVWLAMAEDGTVWRLDPRTGRPRAIIRVGAGAWGLAYGAGSVWVANHCDGSVSRIDPRANEVIRTIRLGFHPQWTAALGQDVWVGISESPAFDFGTCR